MQIAEGFPIGVNAELLFAVREVARNAFKAAGYEITGSGIGCGRGLGEADYRTDL